MARPLAVGVVHTGVDVLLGHHAVALAAGAPSVRLPLTSVESAYGRNLPALVAEFNYYVDGGRPAPQHQRRRSTLQPEHIGLPVRLSGQHLHPQLRRLSWDGHCGRAGSRA